MTFHKWIQIHHTDMLNITKSITNNHQETDDLYSCVIEQLLNKTDKIDDIPDNQKKYYFIRVVRTNWFSKTSPYYYQYKKNNHNHTNLIETITEGLIDEEYEETIPTMKWVQNTLEKEFGWYDKDLFNLWVELGSLTNVSKKTHIPLNSVGRHINQIKKKLKELWLSERQN